MPQKNLPKDWNMNLVPAQDAARLATLVRMRGKLAGRSADLAVREATERRIVRRRTFSWGGRIALALLFLAANAWLLENFREAPAVKVVRKAPAVTQPKGLTLDEQALYWTYALYDFDRLKAKYGAPANAVIDANQAKARLRDLLPKVSGRTRFTIDTYLPKGGPKA